MSDNPFAGPNDVDPSPSDLRSVGAFFAKLALVIGILLLLASLLLPTYR